MKKCRFLTRTQLHQKRDGSPTASLVPALPAPSASPLGQAGLFADATGSQTHPGRAMVLRGSLLSQTVLWYAPQGIFGH